MAKFVYVEINGIKHVCYSHPNPCKIVNSQLKASPEQGVYALVVDFACGTHNRFETSEGSFTRDKLTLEELLMRFTQSYQEEFSQITLP